MPKLEFPFFFETKTLNAETRANLPGDFIELPDGFVHYELGGPEDGAPVVLVHGFSVPNYIWQPTFTALTAAGYRVLRYDLYGRGFSDRPHTRYNRALFDRQLLGLLDALGFTAPVNLFGLSMGGVISANFTASHPQRVAKLGLVDPAGFPLKLSMALQLVKIPGLGEMLFNLLGSKNLEDSMLSDFYEPKHIKHFIKQYRPQMSYKGFKRALLSTMRNRVLERGIDVYRQVGQLDLPVLLVWGRQDVTVPFKYSADVVAAIPQVAFHPIDSAGHIPHYERPEVVNPIILDFLRK